MALPPSPSLHGPVSLRPSQRVTQPRGRERERERGRRWTGTGNTRTGEERRLERNEFGCGTLSKSVLTGDEKVFSVEISVSVYIYLKKDGQRRTN